MRFASITSGDQPAVGARPPFAKERDTTIAGLLQNNVREDAQKFPGLGDLPIIGRLPALDNGLVATGHNMLGLTLSAVTGKIIADLVAERETRLPLEAVSPSRFG